MALLRASSAPGWHQQQSLSFAGFDQQWQPDQAVKDLLTRTCLQDKPHPADLMRTSAFASVILQQQIAENKQDLEPLEAQEGSTIVRLLIRSVGSLFCAVRLGPSRVPCLLANLQEQCCPATINKLMLRLAEHLLPLCLASQGMEVGPWPESSSHWQSTDHGELAAKSCTCPHRS